MPGKGDIKLTGQLGDVMKESAQIGLSYIRAISKKWGIDKEFFKENDIQHPCSGRGCAKRRTFCRNHDGNSNAFSGDW